MSAVQSRHTDAQPVASKDKKAAANAMRAPLLQLLSTPAVVDSLCTP